MFGAILKFFWSRSGNGMSLHYKIVLLFMGVAILPLLIFAGVARQQSLAAADLSAEAGLRSRASAGLNVVETEAASALATLSALARAGAGRLDSENLESLLATGVGPPPDGFRYLGVVDSVGAPLGSAELPARGPGCREGRFAATVQLAVPLEAGGGRLVAEYWPGRSVDVDGLEGAWLRDRRGRLVMAAPCGASGEAPVIGVDGSQRSGSRPLPSEEGEIGTLAFSRGQNSGWTFAASELNVLRGPLARLFRNYWVFVLGLGATAVLAFSLLLRRVTGSMAELTMAAERVAAGDLSPWLPTPRNDEVGHLTAAFGRMTDRLRDLVDQVDRTGRLAILGQLSAYLAHEIRNPLSAVKMNLQRLQRWHRAGEIPERCGGAIQVSLREVDRLSAAVSNILQLTPGEPREKEIVPVHDLVSDAARLLDSEFTKRGVGLRWELNAQADRVLGDPGQLKGVIINLMLNAVEAQPEGGRLLIVSELHAGPGEEAGPFVEIHFIDGGPGIPPEIRDQIFDPFFSTKEHGSGIGLAVARQTIRDHGGDIRLVEARGRGDGAEVVVLLPLAAVAPEDRAAKTEPRVPVWGEGGGVAG